MIAFVKFIIKFVIVMSVSTGIAMFGLGFIEGFVNGAQLGQIVALVLEALLGIIIMFIGRKIWISMSD